MSATNTSRQAYGDLKYKLGCRQLSVLKVIEKYPDGITNLEICRELNWPINTVTPRVFELRTAGLVAEKCRRPCRLTSRKSIAWVRVQGVQLDLFGFAA